MTLWQECLSTWRNCNAEFYFVLCIQNMDKYYLKFWLKFIHTNPIQCHQMSNLFDPFFFLKSRTLKKNNTNLNTKYAFFSFFKWVKHYLIMAETSRSTSLQAKSSRLISQSSLINFNQLMLPVGEVRLEGSLAGRLSETWWTACNVLLTGKQNPSALLLGLQTDKNLPHTCRYAIIR